MSASTGVRPLFGGRGLGVRQANLPPPSKRASVWGPPREEEPSERRNSSGLEAVARSMGRARGDRISGLGSCMHLCRPHPGAPNGAERPPSCPIEGRHLLGRSSGCPRRRSLPLSSRQRTPASRPRLEISARWRAWAVADRRPPIVPLDHRSMGRTRSRQPGPLRTARRDF